MRIAHITPIVPALAGNGLAMRTSMFSQAAASIGNCRVIAVTHAEQEMAQYPLPDGINLYEIKGVADTRLQLITHAAPADKQAELLLQYGRPLHTKLMSAPTISAIIQDLEGFRPELMIISRSYMLPVLAALPEELADMPVVLDLDDDDGKMLLAHADEMERENKPEHAALLRADARLTDKLITDNASRVHACYAASEAVNRSLSARLGLQNVITLVNAIDATARPANRMPTRASLLFVGNLGYRPNVDGLTWFIEEVLPHLNEAHDGLEFVVAGSECGSRLSQLCGESGVRLVHSPEDLAPLYAQATAAIVPLRMGSGSRIKILEAGAHGVPVISTDIGAEGLGLDTDRHFFSGACDAQSLLKACSACLANPDEADARAASLLEFVREHHDRARIVKKIAEHLKRCAAEAQS